MTQYVLIALGVLVVILTIVAIFDLLPPLRIVPDDTHFDFTRFRRISFPISAALSIVAIVLFFTHGLNFGIDFKGGTLLEVQSKSGAADIGAMRGTLSTLGLGDVQLQQFGGPADVLIRVAEQPGGDTAQQAAVQKVRGALGDTVEYRRVEVVGPRVSGELLAYGMVGLMLAIFSILIYLWFRFEWQFALGAMIANVHDIVLTIGFMSISQVDFDLTSIAALLTILGYSLNDTVVIYDRIREMLRRYKKMPMPQLLNESINSTLSRSIITHVTVSLALLTPDRLGVKVHVASNWAVGDLPIYRFTTEAETIASNWRSFIAYDCSIQEEGVVRAQISPPNAGDPVFVEMMEELKGAIRRFRDAVQVHEAEAAVERHRREIVLLEDVRERPEAVAFDKAAHLHHGLRDERGGVRLVVQSVARVRRGVPLRVVNRFPPRAAARVLRLLTKDATPALS